MTDSLLQKPGTVPFPANETERLAALHRYKILDTPAEAAFDRITTLAARLFKVPTALISLVDESRAWFKSYVGFNVPEVPRDATVCSFAVLTDELLIVPDTRRDDRFACNPFVQSDPGMRFYAGAPLLSHDGFNLGTLCLLDTQPRHPLTAEQQATLVDLAAMVVDELELRLAAQRIAQVDAALLEITQGVETVTGEAFVNSLVQHFANVLDTEYVYVGLVEGDDPKMMRTIATYARGQIVDNLAYLLQDTPCWEAIEQRKICCYPRDVQAQFPNAPLLESLSVESYMAIPFFDSKDNVLGLLGVMDSKPLENLNLAVSLLTIFSNRIATELERQQAEGALRESEAKYRSLFESIDEGFCICEMLFDESGQPQDYRFLEVNSVFEALTGLKQATGKTARELLPNLEASWFEIYGGVVQTGKPVRFEQQSAVMNRWFDVNAFCLGEPHSKQFGILFANISDRKHLEQERERFLAVGSDLQVIVSKNGYFQWVSPTFERILGWTQEEMTSHPWAEFVHPDDIDSSISEANNLFSGNETFRFENRCRHRDGSYRCLLWKAQSYLENQAVYATGIDITDRKQIEESFKQSEERLSLALEAAEMATWDVDLKAQKRIWSAKHFEILGYEPIETGEATTEMWHSRVHPNDLEQARQTTDLAQQTRSSIRLEPRILRADNGEIRWLSIFGRFIYDEVGEAIRCVGVSFDISDRKQAEAALEERNKELDSFVHIVSHDLKAPLRAISNLSEWIQSDLEDQLPLENQQQLQLLRTRVKRMESMINSLLLYARAGRQEAPLETFNVAELLSEIIDSLDPPQSFSIEIEQPMPTLTTKRLFLSQVFANLMSNAIKHHTSVEGHLNIRAIEKRDFYEFIVKDDGPGIAPEYHDKIFAIFQTVSAQDNSEIHGVGLAIIKKIVEAEKGTIRLESGLGQGTTFFVTWPKLVSETPQSLLS